MFSARVGGFRLLYTGEIPGIANSEKVGDLNKQEELKKCEVTTARVISDTANWRRDPIRLRKWLHQAYISNAKQLAVARFDSLGKVVHPVEIESVDNLIKRATFSLFNINHDVKHMYGLLKQIKNRMGNLNSPEISLKFHVAKNNTITFEERFPKDFIEFANQL
ncbi:hypothetical protein KR018_003058 [Drosophila ironensis]|nr:hypothetical protein KR018_003058 [Drosophila ironensis]